MKGYRTVILNIVMTLAMGGSVQVADLPPSWRAMFTLAIAGWGMVAILLRIATTTPIGQKAEAAIEQKLGITHEQMEALIAKLPQQADVGALVAQMQTIAADVAAVKAATAPTSIKLDAPGAAGIAGGIGATPNPTPVPATPATAA